MRRTVLQLLEDIVDSAERIEKYTIGIEFEEFTKDTMRMDAVIRNFEVIGEAIKNLPPDLKERYPIVRQGKGDHVNITMPNNALITIPVSKELKIGLLKAMIKKTGLSEEEFLALL